MYLLDTNICAYFMTRKYPSVADRFRATDPKALFVSSITAGELAYGVENSSRIESNRINFTHFLALMQIVPWEANAIWHYGLHKTRLKNAGTKIGEIDLLLGCQALAMGAIFVTNNTREFERIEGLKLENWVA
ncbi:MAG TPA: type II toxin-antitoxin system VapC family toxin [Rhodoferax sp.]